MIPQRTHALIACGVVEQILQLTYCLSTCRARPGTVTRFFKMDFFWKWRLRKQLRKQLRKRRLNSAHQRSKAASFANKYTACTKHLWWIREQSGLFWPICLTTWWKRRAFDLSDMQSKPPGRCTTRAGWASIDPCAVHEGVVSYSAGCVELKNGSALDDLVQLFGNCGRFVQKLHVVKKIE